MAKKSSQSKIKEEPAILYATMMVLNIPIEEDWSWADIGYAILQAQKKSMHWKLLATNIAKLKYPQLDVNDVSKSLLAEIYNSFCLDGRFQYQKGHFWTLTAFLPQETKRKKRATTV